MAEVYSMSGFLKFKASDCFTEQLTEYVAINNFSEFTEGNYDVVRSSNITFNSTMCVLKIYPNGNCAENEGYVSVEFVKYNGDPDLCVIVNCVISVVDNKGEQRFFQSFSHESTDENDVHGIGRFVKRSTLLERRDEFLPNDKLLIHCDISYTVKSGDPSTIWEPSNPKIMLYDFSSNTNLHLEIETQEGEVYKLPFRNEVMDNEICKKSPVFARMLSTVMSEKCSMKLRIEDVSHTTLVRLISYANSDSFMTNSVQETVDLYIAADKYEILALREECTRDLCRNMTAENVCTILNLADMHNDIKLKDIAFSFINANKDAVTKSASYIDLSANKPHLLKQLENHVLSELNDVETDNTTSHEKYDEKFFFYS